MTSVPRSRGLSVSDNITGSGRTPPSPQPPSVSPQPSGLSSGGPRGSGRPPIAAGSSDSPDLSHLTPEERRIIEEVLQRQKQEEKIDAQVLQKSNTTPGASQRPLPVGPKSNQPVNGASGSASNLNTSGSAPFSNTVASMVSGAMHAVSGHSGSTHGILDAVCGICEKTKFADGLGHICVHCRRKTCTRCGYQLNTDVNQVQWTCKPCAQRMENNTSVGDEMLVKRHLPTAGASPGTVPKGAVPTSSSARTLNPIDPKAAGRLVSGFLGMFSGGSQQEQHQQQSQQHQPPVDFNSGRPVTETKRLLPQIGSDIGSPAGLRRSTAMGSTYHGSGRVLPKLNVLSRSTSLDPERNNGNYSTDSRSQRGYLPRQYTEHMEEPDRGFARPSDWRDFPSHQSYPSYQDFQSGDYSRDPYSRSDHGHRHGRSLQDRYPYSTPSRLDPAYGTDSFTSDHSESPGGRSGNGLGWRKAAGQSRGSTNSARYWGPSDPDCVQEPYPQSVSTYNTPTGGYRYHSPRAGEDMNQLRAPYQFSPIPPDSVQRLGRQVASYRSLSSSENEEIGIAGEEIVECPAGLDVPVSGSVRPRRALPSHVPDFIHTPTRLALLKEELDSKPRLSYASLKSAGPAYGRSDIGYGSRKTYASSSIDMPSPSSGRLAADYRSLVDRPRVEDPLYRIGSDTNSLLSIPEQIPMTHPVTWNPSRDGKRLIGHMILRRQGNRGPGDVGSLLGLKIRGGKPNRAGRLCAYVTRVKPGSPADVVGQLRAGDEVLEWSGQSLRERTADEVSRIVHQSKMDAQVELIVQRDLESANEYFGDEVRSASSSPSEAFNAPGPSSTQSLPDKWDREEVQHRPSVQLSLWFDLEKNQLVVHLLCAQDLVPTHQAVNTPGSICNSYCRIRLLPGRDDGTLKYSKLVARTNHPRWNQQFLFADYTEEEIAQHDLELTVWNCSLSSNEQTLMGEIIINLSVADLSGTTYWYPLQMVHINDYSSEAPTPVVGSMTGYESRTLLTSGTEPTILPGQLVDGRSKSAYVEGGMPRSGDYSDIDEKTYGITAPYASIRAAPSELLHYRGNRNHHERSRSGRREYGQDDMFVHSDVSELSDISEMSRMSLHTSQSEKGRFHDAPGRPSSSRHYSGSKYPSGSRISADLQQQISPESSSKSDRPQEPDDTSDEFFLRQRRMAASQREDLRLAKESSSSECGSGMIAPGATGGMYGKLMNSSAGPKDAHGATQMISTSSRGDGRKPRPSIGHKFSTVLGRSHKSSSTSNLDKKTRTSFQRSEEVLPSTETPLDDVSTGVGQRGRLQTQLSLGSGKVDVMGGPDGTDLDSHNSPVLTRNESHVGEFVEGLGPGQLVGRQVLGMPCLGEIQLSFFDRKGHLEVEVIRARGLQHKNTAKPLPAPYVKLHLLEGKQSVEKLRTNTPPRRTLDPLYQQQLTFSMPYHGKIIQISIWGEYGRMDKKVFLGMCEVVLDDLDLRSVVFGWYKLFGMIASTAHHHHHHNRPTALQSEVDSKCSADEITSLSSSKGREEKSSPRTGSGTGSSSRSSAKPSTTGGERSRSKSITEKVTGGRKSVSRDPHKGVDTRGKSTHKHGR